MIIRTIHNHRKYCNELGKFDHSFALKFGPTVFFLSDSRSLMESKWWSFKPYFNSHGGFANWITSYTFIRELNTHEDIVGTKTAKFVWQTWPSCSIEEKSKYTRKNGVFDTRKNIKKVKSTRILYLVTTDTTLIECNIFSNNRLLDFRKFTEIHATIKHKISSCCPLYIYRINQSDMSSHK